MDWRFYSSNNWWCKYNPLKMYKSTPEQMNNKYINITTNARKQTNKPSSANNCGIFKKNTHHFNDQSRDNLLSKNEIITRNKRSNKTF